MSIEHTTQYGNLMVPWCEECSRKENRIAELEASTAASQKARVALKQALRISVVSLQGIRVALVELAGALQGVLDVLEKGPDRV